MRSYFAVKRLPLQSMLIVRGVDGVYRTLTGRVVGIDVPCEHCDGEHSPKVRLDDLRGYVCPSCDSALDEMFDECADKIEAKLAEANAKKVRT